MKSRLLIVVFLYSIATFANINSDLNNFFDGLSMYSNTTDPQAYHGQQAGYYTGGSLYARSRVRNLQIAQVDLPHFNAGCGGIDMFAGGFSFVNDKQLVEMMRNVMNNAKGYAFKLTLAEVTPLIKNVLGDIENIAHQVNQANINSCETAESLVGGVWPKTRMAHEQICQDMGANSGYFKDWADARQGCRTGDLDTVISAASQNPQYKNRVFDNGNIVWKALQANPFFASSDQQLKELLMSLSGSVIIQKNGSSQPWKTLPPISIKDGLLKAILKGGSVAIYHCDEATNCLNPTTQTITIASTSALGNRVGDLLKKIGAKIIEDKPLNDAEIGLIQATQIPIYKILNVQAAYQKNADLFGLRNYSDVIAVDILFQYLQENLEIVRMSTHYLDYPDDMMKKFNEGIQLAMDNVQTEQAAAHARIVQTYALIEQSQVIEKMLAGQLSSELGNSLTWARSVR